MLATRNCHPRDSRIIFDEAPHVYYIDGSSQGWTSTTTFIHTFFAEFNGFICARAMVRGRNFPYGDTKYNRYIPFVTKEDGTKRIESELIKSIQDDWKKEGKEAADRGTNLHKVIEQYYNEMPLPTPLPSDWSYFLEFEEYRKKQGLVPFRTEWLIFSEDHQTSGSIDMIMYRPSDGTYHIFDWKRSKAIAHNGYGGKKGKSCLKHLADCNYTHYSLQLSIYRYILETKYELPITSQQIVVLHPVNDTYKSYQLPYLQKEVIAMFAEKLSRAVLLRSSSETSFKITDFFTTGAAAPPPPSVPIAMSDIFNVQ
jgi:hypothetical protein